MAFILKDRVKESTVTTGTGNLSLAGAAATFDTFQSYLSNGDTTFYAVAHTSSGVDEWEVGLATWNTGNTLSRTTVLSGSNGTSAVNFSAGAKDIFMTLPADKLLHLDANGDVDINGGTIDGTVIGAAQAAASNFTTIDTTGNVSVGGQLDVADWIDLSAQASHPAHGEGRLWYDNIHKTINYYSDDAGVVHELGIEEHARVYNETGSTLSKGTPVHFAGTKTSNGTHVPTVAAANATSSTKYKSEGMVAADIANNSYGYIITAGRLEGIDTSHLSIGQFFTGITDGSTQTAAPVYPNFPMCLGFVVRSDATNGVVFLAQQNHSIKSFRVQMDQHIGGSLTIDGDLNVTGSTNTTSTSDVTAGAPFYRANEGDAIGDANTTFTGSGLDDAFFAGHFTGTASTNYYVKIDGVGTPDTFAVSTDNFSTTISTGNAITGSEQMIHSADNISVKFGATTGHTLNDVWTGTASPINVDTGFFSNRNTGTSGVGYTHMGLFYDASESKWRLVDEYDPVPAGTIDTGHSSYVTGTIAANLEGNVTGNITGNVSGNAATASALESARTIGGVSFDGTANIDLAGVNAAGNQDTTGNAATAAALENARTIQVSGDVTGSASFDGTSDITITTTVQDDSHAHVISNVDGLQTALDAKVPTSRTITAGNGLTGGGDLTANRTLTVGGGSGITVNANDIAIDSSYTGFDGRYYTETEADSRFVNVTGDTMTGDLNLGDNDIRDVNRLNFNNHEGDDLTTVTGDVIFDENFYSDTEYGSATIWSGANGGGLAVYNEDGWGRILTDRNIQWLTATFDGLKVGSNNVFHDGYHPNADAWTTSRTLSLSGDASGSVSWSGSANATLSVTVANDSHTHDGRYFTETESDARFVRKGVGYTWTATGGNKLSFRSENTIDTASGNQAALEVLQDDSGHDAFMQFHVSGDYAKYFGLHGGINDFVVGGWSHGASYQRIFHDGYHPNADAWTTSRTLSLSGDASGSVSWDGSANVTLSVSVGDADTVDGIQGASFLRSDANDNLTAAIIVPSANRNQGIFGTYDSNKTQHIWSMGTTYRNAANGSDFGNLYGLAYYHTNNGQGTMASSHQTVHVINGSPKVALGNNIWTSGSIIVGGTVDGVDIAARNAVLTTTTNTANAALPKAGGTMTGDLTIPAKIIHSGDTDTYFEFHGANLARIVIAGAEVQEWGANYTLFSDSDQVRLGSGSDFRMYFDGTHMNFRNYAHAGGNIYFQGEDTEGSNHALLYMMNDGSAPYLKLYQNGGERLRTLSGGVGVTGLTVGDVDANPHNASALFISTNATDEKIVLSGSSNPYIRFQELTTDKAYIRWQTDGYLAFNNQESGNFRFRSHAVSQAVNIKLEASDGDVYGSVYGTHANEIGFLDQDGNWAYRHARDSLHEWRIDNGVEMSLSAATLDMKGNTITEVEDIGLRDRIYHDGDTDTYIQFGANTAAVVVGGSTEIHVNTTGVRLGDTGNGYFQPVSGQYGSIQIDGGAHTGWEGYSIGGRAVFMHNNGTATGIYNDVENEWLFYGVHNSYTRMYHNGTSKVQTSASGLTVNGDLNSTSDIRYKKNIETIEGAVDKVTALRGVTFDWDNDAFSESETNKKPNFTERATGVIAQDVEKVLPEAVRQNPETGFKNVAYGNMVGLLIEAIKEQQDQINDLKAEIQSMKI